jgi:DNA-binding transcriptional regulator YdaS (Cro superfamily)
VISHDEFRQLVRAAIEAEGGNQKFADKYGFHPVEVSDWKTGKRACTPMLAAAMGWERVIAFAPTSRVEPLD